MTEDTVCHTEPAASSDTQEAREFLLWARAEGFAFEAVRIGKVELVGTRDLFPKPDVRDRDRSVGGDSAYDAFGADLPGYDDVMRGRRPA